jgi:hypothetical protein
MIVLSLFELVGPDACVAWMAVVLGGSYANSARPSSGRGSWRGHRPFDVSHTRHRQRPGSCGCADNYPVDAWPATDHAIWRPERSLCQRNAVRAECLAAVADEPVAGNSGRVGWQLIRGQRRKADRATSFGQHGCHSRGAPSRGPISPRPAPVTGQIGKVTS